MQYKGEADPVDHAHFVKSFLEYVIGVVPKHLAKPQDDNGETSNGTNVTRGGQKRPSLIGSDRWESSWKKHFDEAAEEKRKIDEASELQKRIKGLRSRMESLDDQLEKLQESARSQGLELAGTSNSQADLRKRQRGTETAEPIRVPRKKRKKAKKSVPIFTGKNIAHLYENQQHVDFYMKDNEKEPGAIMWMEALVLAPKAGQDMSDPVNIVYLVKYDKLDGIFELKLGQDYLDGNIIVHGESDDDDEFEDLSLGEVKRQAQERTKELRKNMHKKKSKKRPESNRKKIPDFTGLTLAQCFHEDEDNVPLSSVLKELEDNESKSSSSSRSTIQAIRWMDAKVLGPVPNQPNRDPYHTIYRVKYDELSDIYEVDLGKDYLEGTLICSDFSDSEPEPDDLPLAAVLKEAKNKMSALKRPATKEVLEKVGEKRPKIQVSDPKKNTDKGSSGKENAENTSPETPEEIARKAEVKKLRAKQEKLVEKEKKRAKKHEKRQKEKCKAIGNDAPASVKQQREKRCDKALQKLWDTRQELDSVKKRLVELGEPEEPKDDEPYRRSSWTDLFKDKKKKSRTPSEERREKKREKRGKVWDKLDHLEEMQMKKEKLIKNMEFEVKIAEQQDKKAKKAANINYWLSSPSKEVKEKTALLDCTREEGYALNKEIQDLYDQLSDLSSSATDTPHGKSAKVADLLDFEGLSTSDNECPKPSGKKHNKKDMDKSESKQAKTADVQEGEEDEEKGEEIPEEQQKSPKVLEVEKTLSELKKQERSLAAKRTKTMQAITALKEFENWQVTSSRRPSRSKRHSDAPMQHTVQQPSPELVQKQDVYYETLSSLVEVRKQIHPLLKKLKEMGENLDSDCCWSDDDECEDGWITKGGGEISTVTEQAGTSVETEQIEAMGESQKTADQNFVNEAKDQYESSVTQENQHESSVTQESQDQTEARGEIQEALDRSHLTAVDKVRDQLATSTDTETEHLAENEHNTTSRAHQEALHKEENKFELKDKEMKETNMNSQTSVAVDSKMTMKRDKCKMEEKMIVDTKLMNKMEIKHVKLDGVERLGNQEISDAQLKEINSGGDTLQNLLQEQVECNVEDEKQKAEKKKQRKVEKERRKAAEKRRQEEMVKQKAEEKKLKLKAVEFIDEKIDQLEPVVKHRDIINLHRWDEYLLRKRLEDRVVETNADLSSVYPSEELKKSEELSICASHRAKAASTELKDLRRRRNQILFSDLEDEEEESSEDEVSSDEDGESEDDENFANLDSSEKAKKAEIKELKKKIENLKKAEQTKNNRRKQRWKEVEDEKDFKKWISSSRRNSRRSQQGDDGAKGTTSSSQPTKDELFDLALKAVVQTRQEIYPLQKRLKELGGEIGIESDWIDDSDDADEAKWLTKGASFKEITDLDAINEARNEDSMTMRDTQLSAEHVQDLIESGDLEETSNSNQSDMPSADVAQVGSSEVDMTGSQENNGANTSSRDVRNEILVNRDAVTLETNHNAEDGIMGNEVAKESASILQITVENGSSAAAKQAIESKQDQHSDETGNNKSKTKSRSKDKTCDMQPDAFVEQVNCAPCDCRTSDVQNIQDGSFELNKEIQQDCTDGADCTTTSQISKDIIDDANETTASAELPVNSELVENTQGASIKEPAADDDVVILPSVKKHIEMIDLTKEDNTEVQDQKKKMTKEEKQKAKERKKKERAEAKERRDKERAEAKEQRDKERAKAKERRDKERAEAKECRDKERAEAKEQRKKKRAEADVLDEKLKQLRGIVNRRTLISKHRWDEFELLNREPLVDFPSESKDTAENSGSVDAAGSSAVAVSQEEIQKAKELSVIASQRAEAAHKEMKAVRRKRNLIIISDSESSEKEEEDDSDEKSGSDEEDDSEDGSTEEDENEEEESSEDEDSREGGKSNKKLNKKKEARRKELQDKFKKLSNLRQTRRRLKWKYHEEIQDLKNSEFAASLVNVIKRKEQLYEAAIQREKDTSEEYDRHWKLMKEELSDYASSDENSA